MRKLGMMITAAALFGCSAAWSAGIYTNGLPAATLPLTGIETIPADTNLGQGLNPATESVTLSQLMSFFRAPTALAIDSSNQVAVDMTGGPMFTLTTTSAHGQSLANPTNLTPGQVFRVVVTGDSSTHTLQFGSFYKFTDGVKPLVTVTNGTVSLLTFVVNSATSILGVANPRMQ